MKTSRGVAALVVAGVLLVSACGGEREELAAPKAVSEGFVPASVQQRFAFYETGQPGAREAFANAGVDSLAADGRLWELRIGDRLIGVLQITTLLPDVELEKAEHREPIVEQLLPTARDRIDIGDIAVWSAERDGKTTYLWFGKSMFSLLTVKPAAEDDVDSEAVLQQVLDHMVAAEEWEPVFFDDEEEEEF